MTVLRKTFVSTLALLAIVATAAPTFARGGGRMSGSQTPQTFTYTPPAYNYTPPTYTYTPPGMAPTQ
jgi:hypothetical protein